MAKLLIPVLLIALVLAGAVLALDRITISRLEDLNQEYDQVLKDAIDQITLDVEYIGELEDRISFYDAILEGRITIEITPIEPPSPNY